MKVEEKYEKLVNGELEVQIQDEKNFARLNEINKKYSMGQTTPEEETERAELSKLLEGKDKEYLRGLDGKKLNKIKENLPKAKNVLDLKNEVIKQIKEIKEEIVRRDNLEKLNREAEKIKNEKENLDRKWMELDKKIVKAKNQPEEQKRLIEEQENLKVDFEKNEKDFNEIQQGFSSDVGKKTKFSGKNKEELASMVFELNAKSSMCNEAVRGLLNGKDIGDIEVDKNIKNKKFDANKELAQIVKSYRNKEKMEKAIEGDFSEKIIKQTEKELENIEKYGQEEIEDNENGEKAIKEVSKFEQRFPRLAKMVNWVKEKFGKFRDNDKEENESFDIDEDKNSGTDKGNSSNKKEEQKTNNIEVEEKNNKNIYIPKSRESFVNMLRDTAEKGLEEANKNAINNSDAKSELIANKYRATVEQDQKMGDENYSIKSGDKILDYKTEKMSKEELIERYNKKHSKEQDDGFEK